jgi:hypothetical protein
MTQKRIRPAGRRASKKGKNLFEKLDAGIGQDTSVSNRAPPSSRAWDQGAYIFPAKLSRLSGENGSDRPCRPAAAGHGSTHCP